MKRLLGLSVLAGLLAAALTSVAADPDKGGATDLAKYKQVFAEQLDRIAAERDTALSEALTRHMRVLAELEKRFQLAGDLKPLLAVRKERKRFKSDPAVAAIEPVSEPEALGSLQTQYVERYKQIQIGAAQRVLDLGLQYRRRLEALQKELTRQGRIEEALEVLQEVEGVPKNAAVVQARAQIEAGGMAPTEERVPEPEATALDIAVEDLTALFKGEVTAWNPQTRTVTCKYDFSNDAQLKDWQGGSIDPLRERLVCDREVVKYKGPLDRVLRVEYEGSHFSGDGPMRAAIGESVVADVEPGVDAKAVLHQGNAFFPLHKSQGGAQSYMKYGCSLAVENGKVAWSVGSRSFPAQALQKAVEAGAAVAFGHAESKTMFDNISVTGIVSQDALRKIQDSQPED